jgi:adenylate cyclase class 2
VKEEIEVKFLEIEHSAIRHKLTEAGGFCEHPMQLMRRAIIDYPDRRMQTSSEKGWGWIRVRDEGEKVTCTYKHIANDGMDTTHEIEFTVSSYEQAVALFQAIGLTVFSVQETKRETWRLEDVEIMLDEWPWIPPYIEIEGPSTEKIQVVAASLGLDWGDALTGSSDRVYRTYFPKMGTEESVTDIASLTFSGTIPQWLKERV